MTKFVKVTTAEGDEIYVNPAYVISIRPGPRDSGAKIIQALSVPNDRVIIVPGSTPKELAEEMED